MCNVLFKFLSKSKAPGGGKSKNKHSSWFYCTAVGLSEAATGRILYKKLFLKILQYPQETPLLESIFKKVAGLKARNFIIKRPQLRCFPVNIAKILRLPISKNICERLLFECFNGLMLHGPKGSRCKLYDGIKLQVPSHRSSFCF